MTRSVPVGEVRLLGDRALLVGVADARAGRRLGRALEAHWTDGAVEIVGGFATVMVALCDPVLELDAVQHEVERLAAQGDGAAEAGAGADRTGRTLTVRCAFDGPDLAEVAAVAGRSPAEVVGLLTERSLTVAVMGFAPGFAYLDGLPEPLRGVPRRPTPRPVVPAGSVALANGYAAVYPTASPGGWQLIGRTATSFFSATTPPYAALAPGDEVQLVEEALDDVAGPGPGEPPSVWSPPPGARAVLEVEAPGLRAVRQDGGRRAVAAIGVPAVGPADPVSFLLANRLVGNGEDAGALEITAGTARLRCLEPCHVAVVGGGPGVLVDGTVEPAGQVVPLVAGQLLEVGPMRRGLRAYVAVAGGLLGPEVFGSMASDELSGLGPGPLGRGERLHAGPWAPPLGDHLAGDAVPEVRPGGGPLELRVLPGPHPAWFAPDVLQRLATQCFVVDGRSNRIGLRLRPDRAGAPLLGGGGADAGLDSQGTVVGALQVPPDGEPVVLMPDHATLGGYPVAAVVATADHGLLGQCGPGTEVRFRPVETAEAVGAWRAARRRMEHAVVGHYPLAVD